MPRPPDASSSESSGATTVLTGSGDGVVELPERIAGPAVVRITGNAASRFFGVETLGAQHSLVATLQPYDGVRALDWEGGESTGFTVRASGPWRIEVLPLSSVPTFESSFGGVGDRVVRWTGGAARLVIRGNEAGGQYFEVDALGPDGVRHLVATTDPYAGAVEVDGGPDVFAVGASGRWTITVV